MHMSHPKIMQMHRIGHSVLCISIPINAYHTYIHIHTHGARARLNAISLAVHTHTQAVAG